MCFEVSRSRQLQTVCVNTGQIMCCSIIFLMDYLQMHFQGSFWDVRQCKLVVTDILGQVVREEFLEYLTLKVGTDRLS